MMQILRRWLVPALLIVLMCGAAHAADAPELMVFWVNDEGIQEGLPAVLSEDETAYSVTLPLPVLPELSVERVTDGEMATVPLTAVYLGESDGAHQYQITTVEDGPSVTLSVYLTVNAPEPTPAEPEAAPAGPATVIAHYRGTDGTEIMPDEVYEAPRGEAFAVYARPVGGEWIAMSDLIQYVDVPLTGEDTLEVTFLFAQPTPTPAPPQVKVTVHYRDYGGISVASDTTALLPGGTTAELRSAPDDLRQDYYPASESVQTVELNKEGLPQEITFFYEYRAPATPAPAYAMIRYQAEDGTLVANDEQVSGAPGQTMTLYAAPEGLKDFYVLDDEETKQVTLPESGGTAEVVFRYRLELPQTQAPTATPEPAVTATPQPAPVVAFVQVSYIYQGNESLNDSEPVTVYQGQTTLNGQEGLRTGYSLISAGEALVTVDENGTAEPARVTFVYAPEASEITMPELIVHYRADDGTAIATSTLVTLHVGENTIYASPADLKDGYEQVTPSYTVRVDEQGHADTETVVFYYRAVDDNSTASDGFQVTPASGYARANNDSVNLRSFPSTSSDSSVIGKIRKTDIIQILGTANYGGKWYYVSVNERQGYVSASVVTELSDADVQVLLGLNREDEGGDTLVDPETGLIERWAQVNKKVWFRSAPGGKRVSELKKGTRVFVDEAKDEDGTLWYKVRHNGREGYIMAEFLTMYSASESQNLQFSLPTAVPTHTVAATRVPTSTPTAFIPTATPTAPPVTPAPVMTATPIPYTGYAITNARATLRDGLTTENTALATLNGETLVMVQGQTYVNGVCWDSIRVISSGLTGFMEDERLVHITNELALDYLEVQATATPVPTPDTTPIPFTDYALILMDGVPMRQQMNSNAQYLAILSQGTVVSVLRQTTSDDGESWCLIQNGMYLGYVRRDLLRQMSDEEIFNYLEANRSRPTPTPAVTATPRAQSAMASCWGIIRRDRVQLRSQPSMTTGTSLRLMSRNEFIQVQGSFLGDDEQVWQQVMYGGQTGYIRADYIQILTQGELTSVVTSDDFKSANTTETTVTGADSIQSYETYLVNQWSNPSLTASYEPFDPYTTPAAVIASQVTEPPRTPALTMPPTPEATIVVNPDRGAQQNAGGGISMGPILIVAGILAVGGGAFFAWKSYSDRKRRQALQRAQALRRRQQSEPKVSRETRSAYRRDSAGSFAMQSTARPVPPSAEEDTTRRNTPVTARYEEVTEDRTSAFRRPEATARMDLREEFKAEDTPAAPVRRRRTERNHYDEDGN